MRAHVYTFTSEKVVVDGDDVVVVFVEFAIADVLVIGADVVVVDGDDVVVDANIVVVVVGIPLLFVHGTLQLCFVVTFLVFNVNFGGQKSIQSA